MSVGERPAIVRVTDEHALSKIASSISQALRADQDTMIRGAEQKRRIGELLASAKALLPHGTWQEWLSKNFELGERAARRYMLVHEEWSKLTTKGSPPTPEQAQAIFRVAHSGTEATKLFCKKCAKNGPARNCKECKRMRAEAAGRDADAAEPGEVKFDWNKFSSAFGHTVRQIDSFGRAYRIKDGPQCEALRRKLSEVLTELKQLFRTYAKEEPPE